METAVPRRATRLGALCSVVAALGGLTALAAAPDADADGHHDPAAYALADDWGVDMEEAQRRIVLQTDLDRASESLADRLGARFAGVWMDQAAGAGVLATIGTLEEAREALRAEGLEGSVEPRKVGRSLRQLTAVRDQLAREATSANADASFPLLVGMAIDSNQVRVEAPTSDRITSDQRAFLRRAEQEHGPAIATTRVNVDAESAQVPCLPIICTPTTTTPPPPTTTTTTAPLPQPRCDEFTFPGCDEPLRAGLRTDGGGRRCTVGFIARSGSSYYAFTAGHCFNPSAGSYNWSVYMPKDGRWHTVGPTYRSKWDSGGDMAIVQVNNPSGWGLPRNWTYVRQFSGARSTAENPQYPITSTGTSGGMVGSYVCYTGGGGLGDWQGTGTKCGIVETHDTSLTYDGVYVAHLARVKAQLCRGASGGPVYAYNVAYGIAVALSGTRSPDGQCGEYMYYQGIRGAESTMGAYVVTG